MSNSILSRVIFSSALILSLTLCGCSNGNLAGKATPVEGTVMMDDKPLAKVYVQFMPEDSKLPGSTAMTDDNGHYILKTSDDRMGAIVGKHKVIIRSERGDERSGSKGSPRSVPLKYSLPSAENPLGVDVNTDKKSGYDFDLKSK